jgi:hypothetical protein
LAPVCSPLDPLSRLPENMLILPESYCRLEAPDEPQTFDPR